MSSEAGEADNTLLTGESSSASNTEMEREDDPVGAVYNQQAKFEQGSPSSGDSAADRAKLFLAKKKAEAIEQMRSLLTDRISTYDAIKNHNLRAMAVPNLIGGLNCNSVPVGDFISSCDGRLAKTKVIADFGEKTNTSYSFNSSTMSCISCSIKHQLLGGRRTVFILTDQAFPPALPSSTEKQCLFILRIENGSLADLVDKFLLITRGWKIPPGSILVVTSASHLARCGTAAYAAALASNGGRILRAFHGEVEWIPGPPILLSGTSSPELIRSLVEISTWIRVALPEPSSTLADTFGVLTDMVKANGVGPPEQQAERRFMLPCTLTHLPDMKTWASADMDQPLPREVKSFSEEVEAAIITTLIAELNCKLGFDLEQQPSFSRILDPSAKTQPNMGGGYLMIGSSNAARTSKALREEGNFVNNITLTNWRAKVDAVLALTEHVKEAIRVGQTGATIFQLFDGLFYLGMLPDGTTSRPLRDNNGRYHVVGELVVAGKEAQYSIYKALKPVLLAAAGGPIILVTPLPRFITHGCCEDETHLTNRSSPDFATDQQRHLAETRTNLRSFLFSDNIRSVSVINPAPLFDGVPVTESWDGKDPIHPREIIYRELAKLVNKNTAYLQGKKPESSAYEDGRDRRQDGPPAKRGRDWSGGGAGGRGGWAPFRGGRRRGGEEGGNRHPRYS